jgi:hypothetical protein
MKKETNISIDINRWIRYEEDYDFDIQRWQGLFKISSYQLIYFHS